MFFMCMALFGCQMVAGATMCATLKQVSAPATNQYLTKNNRV